MFTDISAEQLQVGDIFTNAARDSVGIVTKIIPGQGTRTLHVRELNQVEKVFGNEDIMNDIANNFQLVKINCAPAAAPAPQPVIGGGSRRKRSTSRNNRKLRRA